MEINTLQEIMSQGENSSVEFKSGRARPETIAREMVAFSNTYGGIIFLGVEDDRSITGVTMDNVEEWLINIARNNVVPSISPVVTLLKYLDNMRYIDGIGRGVPMMISEMKDKIHFQEIGELFRVTIQY